MDLHKKYSLCRNCRHPYFYHCIHVDVKQGDFLLDIIQPFAMVPCSMTISISQGTESRLCNCNDWLPEDNLEYLAQIYNEKNKENK